MQSALHSHSRSPSPDDLLNDSKSEQPLSDRRPPLQLMSAWQLEKAKAGGANGAGSEGGIYVDDLDNPRYRVLFKQDEVAKNICEVVAGGIMRDLTDDPGAFAEVAFSLKPGVNPKTFDPDKESGENVYVASVYFDKYHDLCDDAYMASAAFPDRYNPQKYVSHHEENRLPRVVLPNDRPKLHQEDITIKRVIRLKRYRRIEKVLAMSLFCDDPDVHPMNLGPVHDEECSTEEGYCKQIGVYKNGQVKVKTVYEAVKTVRIDYGGALGSKKITHRRLDGHLHLDDFFTMLSGPPNYFLWYPSEIIRSAEFAKELLYLSEISQEKMMETIEKQVKNAAQYYNSAALLQFADLIGVALTEQAAMSKAVIVQSITQFMIANFIARQDDARKLAQKIERQLREGGRAIDCIKRAYKRVYNPDNLQRSDRAAFFGLPTPGNVYNQFEAVFFVLTTLKNVVKIFTEYLPAILSELATFEANRIVLHSAQKKHHQLSFEEQASIFLLFIVRLVGETLLAVGSRITSPIRAANETYDLIYGAHILNRSQSRKLAKALAYLGYGLSLAFSACAMASIAVFASTGIAIMLGSPVFVVAAVHAIPYLTTIGGAIATALTPIAAALHVTLVEPFVAAAYAGAAVFLTATLISLRMMMKWAGRLYSEKTSDIPPSVNTASQVDSLSSSPKTQLSSTARYGHRMSLSTDNSSDSELSTRHSVSDVIEHKPPFRVQAAEIVPSSRFAC